MLYFALPNFFENFHFNAFLHNLSKTHPHFFKTKVSFFTQQGGFPYHSWNGGINSNIGNGAYYDDFIDLQRRSGMPFRINCANVLLEDYDFHDNMSQIMLECLNNGSVILEVSSIPLMEKIQEKYPQYRFMFSKQADLITEFNPDLINGIIDTNNFVYIGIPDKYTFNLEWLKLIKRKGICEITVNPLCPASCKNCDVCLLKEHENQIQYSNQRLRETCNDRINIFDEKNILTIEKILSTYSKMGYNRFTFSNIYAVKDTDYQSFLLYYFIKQEYLNEAMSMWSAQIEQMNAGGVVYEQ